MAQRGEGQEDVHCQVEGGRSTELDGEGGGGEGRCALPGRRGEEH